MQSRVKLPDYYSEKGAIDNDSEMKRTRSDPGLNNSDDKFELVSSGSDVESIETCFPSEIAELKQENYRLSNELEFLKIELRNLKLEISNKNNQNCACNDAGSLTNIIQEIRTAHILMEKTLESKLNQLCTSFNENLLDRTQVSSIREKMNKFENSYILTNTIFQEDSQLETNKLQKQIDNLQSQETPQL
ncbi:uncharacterized protein LOC126901343 isoform X2 [Daktulosphaira vitifoliae]|uniref:uncharacterized protein LOC126901343 isoform X2 n=1 Tax=Daktulosphaira vitifoliae TaxID=58002 RepID=UPI0021A9FF09|nr:uncharacterized protein LOC126901343 isoform X2 [Daktulosphaira vitifoliae]